MRLIDKDVIITEIARQKAQWRICKSSEAKYRREMLDDIFSFIDTLEVKEVNEIDIPVSHSLTEEGLFTFEDGSQAIITKIE